VRVGFYGFFQAANVTYFRETTTMFFRITRFVAPALAVAGFFGSVTPAQAGWDNVFQVACWNCKPRESTTRSSYYAAPQPSQHTTRYEEKEHYETITVMKPTVIREEVPVTVKSYYWDPVTTYTTRSYRDPETGCTQEMSVPKTTMVRKEQCNTVSKYVERMKMMPTEVRRKVVERTPVTTIVGPTTKSYSYECDNCGLPPASAQRAPQVEVIPSNPPAASIDGIERISPQGVPNSKSRTSSTPTTPAKPFNGKVNANTTSTSSSVRGEVLLSDKTTPKAGAKVVFLNAANFEDRVHVQADEFGSFTTQLPAGKWFVYLGNGNGRADKTTEITVASYESKPVLLVSK
jgi:hypothetical protein